MKTTIKLIVTDEHDQVIDYFRFDYVSQYDLDKSFRAAFTHLQSMQGVCVQNDSKFTLSGKVIEKGTIPFWYPQSLT